MDDLVITSFDFRMDHKVFQNSTVFKLRYAEDGHPVRGYVGADGGDGVGHIVEFGEVFLGVPLVDALGQEFLVLLQRVVDGIEQVLKVIETDEADFIGLLLLGFEARETKTKSQKYHYYNKVSEYAKNEKSEVVMICAKIESELAELNDTDKAAFLNDLGIPEAGLDQLIKKTYSLLGLATFFTAGSDEVRAWTFKKGMKAPECAGIIHTDFQKGFIKNF